MSIYTKKGDKGTTSLINGTHVAKNHIRVETYGTIDELNANIALLECLVEDENSKKELLEIENCLFAVQTHLAVDPDKECFFQLPDLHNINANNLEKYIDAMNAQLDPMRSFILLGGHSTIAQCHITRCTCRRAERTLFTLSQGSFVPSEIMSYINRLSDYLFILARYTAKKMGVKEQVVSM